MTDGYLPPDPDLGAEIGAEIEGEARGARDEALDRSREVAGRLELGARVLRVVAYLSLAAWAAVVVSGISLYWDQITQTSSAGSARFAEDNVVAQVVVSIAQTSWGYLAVAVLAYAAALLVDAQRQG